jgi:hypothetical protein
MFAITSAFRLVLLKHMFGKMGGDLRLSSLTVAKPFTSPSKDQMPC